MQSRFHKSGIEYLQHVFNLPLDYNQPDGENIRVFAREVRRTNSPDLPWLVYFQGGPGFPSPRVDGQSGWLKRALKSYRVLLLDQRGTGLSTPLTHQTLSAKTTEQQAEYFSHFRADNIVRDAEAIRALLGTDKWSILGQSFGGFCSLHYLSFYATSLDRVYITGGIPSLTKPADDVYALTYQEVERKNKRFFDAFPDMQAHCIKIADHLLDNDVRLPNGQRFTVEQFQLIGINLGAGQAHLPFYFMLEKAFVEVESKTELSYAFLNEMLAQQAYLTNPIYHLLHEACYGQQRASDWSAHRVRQRYPQFNYQKGKPFLFTGEMVYPWMLEQLETLKPLKAAGQLLAQKDDWPRLYDKDALANNTVPVACAVYADDMYVPMANSLETLDVMAKTRAWITNEYEHNGLRADGERILDKLMAMAEELAQLP